MAIKKNHINALVSVLLIMVITGCSGNGSKSNTNINTKGHSWTDSHSEIQDTQMVRLDAFKKGMQ